MGDRLNRLNPPLFCSPLSNALDAGADNTFHSRDLHSHSQAVVVDDLDRSEGVEGVAVHLVVHSTRDSGRVQRWLASGKSMAVANLKMEPGAGSELNADADVVRSRLLILDHG